MDVPHALNVAKKDIEEQLEGKKVAVRLYPDVAIYQ